MIDINKYIDINNQVALKGEKGYYIEPNMIIKILVKEIGLAYEEIIRYCETAKVNLTVEEIKQYLMSKREKEHPGILEEYTSIKEKLNNNIVNWTEEEVNIRNKAFNLEMELSKYTFDSYTLTYYKRYIAILKTKCENFFDLIHKLNIVRLIKQNDRELANFIKQMEEYDIDLNENGILYSDVVRIVEPLIYNINELKRYLNEANSLETYYTQKMSSKLYSVNASGDDERSLYPYSELQIKWITYNTTPEYISLTERQKEKLMNKKVEDFSAWLDDDPDKSKLKK